MYAVALMAMSALPTYADAITVNGTQYDDVYIRESAAFYYIQFPETGAVKSARKSDVPASDVLIEKDASVRSKRLKQWRAKQKARNPKRASKYDNKAFIKQVHEDIVRREAEEKAKGKPVTKPDQSVPQLTNLTNQSERNRPAFINRSGVIVCTNRPDRYRDQADFIEVMLGLDPIDVPKQFRAPGPRKRPHSSKDVEELVDYYAQRHTLDPSLIMAVIKQESNFKARAVSHAGAQGLMQLMPGTAAEMGVTQPFDPAENIAGGTQYLAKMLRLFDGNVDLALAGYNAGPANVKKHGGIPPFRETQNYVRRVKRLCKQYADGETATQLVAAASRVPSDSGAGKKAAYVIRLKNGWTQPADEVGESDRYYFFVTDAGRRGQIRKNLVKKIDGPV